MEYNAKAVREEVLSDFSEVWNNLIDDLELDLKEGDQGYKTYKESYKAIKKYTLQVIKKKASKWEKRVLKERKK